MWAFRGGSQANAMPDARREPAVRWSAVLMRQLAVVVTLVLCVAAAASAQSQTNAQDLRRLSLEQLMQIDVVLVARQPEPAGTAAAAVSVVTRDDIRRSGVTTIADALGLAEGLHVARFNNGTWSITARGFNGSTPNKLLVMIDGRTEFTPLFTGVFWNILDYVLDDIDRIEVIRGPGGTLWGANAVNGVVNIVTRSAADTHGTYVSLASGNEDPGIAEVRYGAGTPALSYRIYGKFAQRDAQLFSTGGASGDTRRRGQAGLRLDGTRGQYSWMTKADLFHGADEFIDRDDGEWTEIGVQSSVRRQYAGGASVQVQAYYRREYRNIERQLTHHLDTVDIDFQNGIPAGTRHNVIWGAAYRRNQDATFGSAAFHFEPANRTYPVAACSRRTR